VTLSGRVALLAAALVALPLGPYDIKLLNTPNAPSAKGTARLVWTQGPFGVTVTADGRARYDVQLDVTGLPTPSAVGGYSTYVAWAASTNLDAWHRLGTVRNGTSTVGQVELNKFLLVITAERDSLGTERKGPTVLHGISPSGWLQSLVTHPLFRGISQ
jgi:hypothetical protein